MCYTVIQLAAITTNLSSNLFLRVIHSFYSTLLCTSNANHPLLFNELVEGPVIKHSVFMIDDILNFQFTSSIFLFVTSILSLEIATLICFVIIGLFSLKLRDLTPFV